MLRIVRVNKCGSRLLDYSVLEVGTGETRYLNKDTVRNLVKAGVVVNATLVNRSNGEQYIRVLNHDIGHKTKVQLSGESAIRMLNRVVLGTPVKIKAGVTSKPEQAILLNREHGWYEFATLRQRFSLSGEQIFKKDIALSFVFGDNNDREVSQITQNIHGTKTACISKM